MSCCGAQYPPHSGAETARTDFAPAARFELAAHVNVRQPDSQQNITPAPDNQTRDETAKLIAAALAASSRALTL